MRYQAECSLALDDGLALPETITAEVICNEAYFAGVRVTLLATLEQARIPLQVDIGFADLVTPAAEQIVYPVLLAGLSWIWAQLLHSPMAARWRSCFTQAAAIVTA